MGLTEYRHKRTQNRDSRRTFLQYNERKGIFERDENLPQGHSGKHTIVADSSDPAIDFSSFGFEDGTWIYITMVQFAWQVPGGGAAPVVLQLVDPDGFQILADGLEAGNISNHTIGDGSAVLTEFQIPNSIEMQVWQPDAGGGYAQVPIVPGESSDMIVTFYAIEPAPVYGPTGGS